MGLPFSALKGSGQLGSRHFHSVLEGLGALSFSCEGILENAVGLLPGLQIQPVLQSGPGISGGLGLISSLAGLFEASFGIEFGELS